MNKTRLARTYNEENTNGDDQKGNALNHYGLEEERDQSRSSEAKQKKMRER